MRCICIFTRSRGVVQQHLGIPYGKDSVPRLIGYGEVGFRLLTSNPHFIDVSARLLVALMGHSTFQSNGKCQILRLLLKLLRTMRRFLHPSNNGPWTPKCARFTAKLSTELGRRLGKAAAKGSDNRYELQDAVLEPLFQELLRCCHVAMFGQEQLNVFASMRALAEIAPVAVTRLLVGVAQTGLGEAGVDKSHQTPVILNCLATLVPLLIWPVPHIAPYLVPLMEAALPGLDPNDSKKTFLTLKFYRVSVFPLPLLPYAN